MEMLTAALEKAAKDPATTTTTTTGDTDVTVDCSAMSDKKS